MSDFIAPPSREQDALSRWREVSSDSGKERVVDNEKANQLATKDRIKFRLPFKTEANKIYNQENKAIAKQF